METFCYWLTQVHLEKYQNGEREKERETETETIIGWLDGTVTEVSCEVFLKVYTEGGCCIWKAVLSRIGHVACIIMVMFSEWIFLSKLSKCQLCKRY